MPSSQRRMIVEGRWGMAGVGIRKQNEIQVRKIGLLNGIAWIESAGGCFLFVAAPIDKLEF